MVGTSAAAHAQTNYPMTTTLELRDSNGRLITAGESICPEDGVSVYSNGWAGSGDVSATFHSDPVDLGRHPTDGQGVLEFTFRVAEVTAGMHTLRLEGTGGDGRPRVVEAGILCECKRSPVSGGSTTGGGNGGGNGAAAVLGQTVNRSGGVGGTGGALAYAVTGFNPRLLLSVGFDLLVVGYALRRSTSLSRARRGGRESTRWSPPNRHGARPWAPIQ